MFAGFAGVFRQSGKDKKRLENIYPPSEKPYRKQKKQHSAGKFFNKPIYPFSMTEND